MKQPIKPVLELQDVSFRYPDGSVGLDGCSITIPRGKRVALLGANGAGKTTLFLHLNGILRPQSGTVSYNGTPLDYSRKTLHILRSRAGLVFQNPDSQLFSASVREDISFGPLNLGQDTETVRNLVEETLHGVGMTALADKPVHNLSYGQKKRVCIAGVLAMKPEVLVLDEPMAGLDVNMQNELMELLEQLHRQGITIIMATHDMNLAYAWADELCILNKGRTTMQCPTDDLPEMTAQLKQHGLEVPLVIQFTYLLQQKGLSVFTREKPRSCQELLSIIQS